MTDHQQEQRPASQHGTEHKGVIADSAPIIASGILAGGQIIAAKISSGKDKGDGKS
jgi:hypothetical protein